MTGFAVAEKALKSSRIKSFQLIGADKIFKTLCGNVFEINGPRDI